MRGADNFVVVLAVRNSYREFFHKPPHSLKSFDFADSGNFFLDGFRWIEVPYFHGQDIFSGVFYRPAG